MRGPPLAFLVALALLPGTGRAQSGGSRNCVPPKEFRLGNDTYRGSFAVVLTFAGGPAQMNFALENRVEGTLELACARDGQIRSVQGDVTWRLGGRGASGEVTTAAMDFTGTGRLQRGPSWGERFTASAELTVPGSVSVSVATPDGPVGGGTGPFAGSGPLDLVFKAERYSCDGAEGTFTAKQIQQTIDGLTAQGFAVEGDGVGRWSVTAPGERTDDYMKELQRRLGPLPPPGVDRGAEMHRLEGVQTWLLGDVPARVYPCLWETWVSHVRTVLAQWVGEETRELGRYQGEPGALQPILVRAFTVDRALVLLGMDECEASLHQRMWDAIGPAYERLIRNLIKTPTTPPGEILKPLREAELLGVVSPKLRELAEDVIMRRIRAQADATWNAYRALRSAAGKSGRCRPDVRIALREAVRWETAYELNGGASLDRAVGEAMGFGDCPPLPPEKEPAK